MRSAQYPSLVMIIRHGEKPGDPAEDTSGGKHLSALGSARAAALPSLFTPSHRTEYPPPPVWIPSFNLLALIIVLLCCNN